MYLTESLIDFTVTGKLDTSSSDHLPIFASIAHHQKKAPKMKIISRRCTHQLTKEMWRNSLINKNWELLDQTEDVDEKANIIIIW